MIFRTVTSVIALAALAACTQAAGDDPAPTRLAAAGQDERAPAPEGDRVLLFGDTHVHTINSIDAFSSGMANADIDTAYRFARGEPVVFPRTGQRVQIDRPLDFIVIADHAVEQRRRRVEAAGVEEQELVPGLTRQQTFGKAADRVEPIDGHREGVDVVGHVGTDGRQVAESGEGAVEGGAVRGVVHVEGGRSGQGGAKSQSGSGDRGADGGEQLHRAVLQLVRHSTLAVRFARCVPAQGIGPSQGVCDGPDVDIC